LLKFKSTLRTLRGSIAFPWIQRCWQSLRFLDRQLYARKVPEAQRRSGRRDPNDVDILALALHVSAPLWSNDNDFEDAGVEWYTTAELLRKLATSEREE